LLGFAILGLNLLNSHLAVAVLSLGIGEYLGPIAGGLSARSIALIAIVGSTLLGVLNIRTNALVTGLFVLVELIALAVLSALGFGHALRSPLELLSHPVTLQGSVLAPVAITGIGMSVAVAIFAYDGYGAAVYFGEEMHAAPRRIGRAIVAAALITVAAEIIPLTAVLMGAPDLKALLGSKSVIGDFVLATGGPVLQRALSLGVALAILNAVIATVLLVSRQLYSTGRDRIWPRWINTPLVRVHPRLHSPWVATLVSGALACGLCFFDMRFLLKLSGAGVVFVYALMCLAAIQGRRTGSSAHGLHRMPLYPWAPIVTLIALAGVAWTAWADPEEGRVGLIASVATGVVFGLYYLIFIRRRRDWRLQDSHEAADTFE
jgi:amino acid transporter